MNTKILLKKVFLKHFPHKLLLKKQGFAGFPNEMVNFLGPYNKYIINDVLKFNNLNDKINKLDRATCWKIYNIEMYLRTYSRLYNFN